MEAFDLGTVVIPVVHMNGDTAEALTGQLHRAYIAISDAIDVLRECAPNGRNYYPAPGLLKLAQAQHAARIEALHNVRYSLVREQEGIEEQRR